MALPPPASGLRRAPTEAPAVAPVGLRRLFRVPQATTQFVDLIAAVPQVEGRYRPAMCDSPHIGIADRVAVHPPGTPVGEFIRVGTVSCEDWTVAAWSEFVTAEPELAQRVRKLFTAHKHHTMATLRKDGSPRISGTEVDFADDGLALGMMRGSLRAADLRRDPRLALHSCTTDPDEDPTGWLGDAKISGSASEVGIHGGSADSHRFLIDLGEIVITRVGTPADHLVIETWHAGSGFRRIERR